MRRILHFLPCTLFLVTVAISPIALAKSATEPSPTVSPTPATSPSPEAMSQAEPVIVTGSHIPTAEEVGPNPILEIDREQIKKSGERTTAELLRRLPIDGQAGVAPVNNAGAGNLAGASAIALRGFDASSTLVLLDGKRLAPFPTGAPPTGGITFVDLNSIPKPALDSIEILKDSASSIYGADAVAGVVNIKFRRDYRGAEVTTSYGNTLDKDSGEYSGSLVFGVGDDNTDVTGVLNYYHRNGIFDRDRAFFGRVFSTNSSPVNLQLSRGVVLAAGVPEDAIHAPPNADPIFGHAPFLRNGDDPATDYTFTRGRSSFFDPNQFQQAVPDSERYGGFVNATHKICGDQLVAYADFFYQNVKTRYELAPPATSDFETPGSVTLAIPPDAPIAPGSEPPNTPTHAETGVPADAFNPFNPFHQIISGGTRARLAEFGDRINNNQTDALFSTLGVKGDKLFDGNWGYDASFRYSEVKNDSVGNGVSASRFNRILNAADPIFDPTSSQFIGTTTPYNPFGDYRRPIATNFLPVEFATVVFKDFEISKLTTLDLNIYTTSLFSLPAGGVGLAFGGQFRRETLSQEPDQLEAEGDVIGSTPGQVTKEGGRKTFAFYAEVSIPVVSETNRMPGIRSLEFTAAGRFEDFRNNNTNVLVPKVGVRWQPFDESLTIRATWGEGFHEPSVFELFANPSGGINMDFVTDPGLNNQPVGEIPVIVKSNRNLQPEDSRSFNAGFVFTPKFVPGLNLTVDFWDIESTGRAFIPTLQDVIDRNHLGLSFPLEIVDRDPVTNEITKVEEAFQNAGSRKAKGIDFGLSYELDTQIGQFNSLTQVTYLESLKFAQTVNTPEEELRSASFGGNTSALKWKGTSSLDYTLSGFSTGVTAYYLDGFHEVKARTRDTGLPYPNSINEHYVSQTWMFDMRASYTFNFASELASPANASGKNPVVPSSPGAASYCYSSWQRLLNGSTIALGCNNVFGQDPPRSGNPKLGSAVIFPAFLYDPTGRFVYLRVTKIF